MKISQRIIDYAIWYYLRYYPSPKKLEQKLRMKFGPNSEKGKQYGGITDEEIEYILTEKLKNIIQETEVIESKIRNYKNKGKSKLYIKQKLFERQENRELIEQYLTEAFIDGELELAQKEYEKIKDKINLKLELTEYEKKQKIVEKLMRKGFKYDDISKIID